MRRRLCRPLVSLPLGVVSEHERQLKYTKWRTYQCSHLLENIKHEYLDAETRVDDHYFVEKVRCDSARTRCFMLGLEYQAERSRFNCMWLSGTERRVSLGKRQATFLLWMTCRRNVEKIDASTFSAGHGAFELLSYVFRECVERYRQHLQRSRVPRRSFSICAYNLLECCSLHQ